MRLARLYQPRSPLFWLMIAFNLMSTVLAWVVRHHELSPLAATVIAVCAIGNAVFGLVLALRLMRS